MPFSHHSHSGQFCGHATNILEEVIQDAIQKGMTTFCTTEHIPRDREAFYPREEETHTPESLWKLFDEYYHEARRLQQAYRDRIDIFIGFEGEWLGGPERDISSTLLSKYDFDLFVGSVHHVHTIPIDYDKATYHRARDFNGGGDERLFLDYFDAQWDMLQTLKPPVVGHFDLIRLFSDDANRTFQTWPKVWEKAMRNLAFIAEYGGVVELNSASLRKGMDEAYPKVDICKGSREMSGTVLVIHRTDTVQEFKALGGRFTLSDDSHGVSQVGLNYHKVLQCIERAGITELHHLAPVSPAVRSQDSRFPKVGWKAVSIHELKTDRFWTSAAAANGQAS